MTGMITCLWISLSAESLIFFKQAMSGMLAISMVLRDLMSIASGALLLGSLSQRYGHFSTSFKSGVGTKFISCMGTKENLLRLM